MEHARSERIVSLQLTPQQWEAIQELLNLSRHPRLLLPVGAGTITFDGYPMAGGPIPSGTDLMQSQPYGWFFGVTFSCIGSPRPAVYAVADFTGRSGNVISVNNPGPNSGENPWFTGSDGTIVATFDPPVKSASIDAYPAANGNDPPSGQPYIAALDQSGNKYLPVTEYPPAGWAAGQHNPPQGPPTGIWETMTVSRPQADIYSVEISVSNSDCEAVFDNLSFHR